MTRPRARPVVPLEAALAVLLLAPSGARGQEAFLEVGDAGISEIARRGPAIVLEAPGPALTGRREFYRPVASLPLRHRWILVQDSTAGVVFSASSGVKTSLDGFEGDLYLRTLQAIVAVEVRALLFNVWGDPAGYVSMSALRERSRGDGFDLHPRWRDLTAPMHEHRTSIAWIHRVMFDDESVVEADLASVAAAWSYVTGSDFGGLPEESLRRAPGP